MRDHYGWIDTPLIYTRRRPSYYDEVKNIVEGMGIGLIFDGAAMALGKGKSTKEFVRQRGKSVVLEKL